MQTYPKAIRRSKLIARAGGCLSLSLLFIGCSWNAPDSFESAIEKEKSNGVHIVQPAGTGVPYFQRRTLNPVWSEAGGVVRIPQFELRDQNNRAVNESHFNGKVSVVSFFFASCKGFCSTLVQNIRRAEKSLANPQAVQFVALTVNSQTEGPNELKHFANHMKLDPKTWTLLTGDQNVIHALAKETFASQVVPRLSKSGERSFAHSEHVYVIDQKGYLRAVLNGTRLDLGASLQKTITALNSEARLAKN